MSPDKVILVPGVLANFQTSVEYGLGPTNLLILRASIHELTVYPPSFSYFQNNFFFFFIWWIFVRFRSDISTSIKLSLALKGHIPDKCHCHTSFIQFPILTNKTRLQEWREDLEGGSCLSDISIYLPKVYLVTLFQLKFVVVSCQGVILIITSNSWVNTFSNHWNSLTKLRHPITETWLVFFPGKISPVGLVIATKFPNSLEKKSFIFGQNKFYAKPSPIFFSLTIVFH